ncbi:glycosyltransferase [Microbacterium suaedae]|uniref:glycosyltransferase n=1 Tax=Microbacterium suaedae TaxID=2067813 RepID=UPI000DA217A6|nr:glycosyltransferase [Microbacterium suaedae]
MSGVIVHEWLERSGGAENVFEAMRSAFPDAASWCLWDDSAGRFPGVRQTPLAATPLRRSKTLALPMMPFVWRSLPAADASWMLVSSHLFAHHARFRGAAREIPKYVYAHTPARYIWTPSLDPRGASPLVRAAAAAFKPLDRHRAREATAIAANSEFVATRIRDVWDRDAQVIHPPVRTSEFAGEPELSAVEEEQLAALPEGFLLAVSRWVSYKKIDDAIHVAAASGRPLVIAGRGPDEARLRETAAESKARVEFLHHPSRSVLRALYRRAAALLFPPVEDFGIVAVEAMASGTPVVVNGVGGATESVVDGVTGAHLHDWADPVEARSAVETALAASGEACRRRAAEFDEAVFAERIRAFIAADGGSRAAVRS